MKQLILSIIFLFLLTVNSHAEVCHIDFDHDGDVDAMDYLQVKEVLTIEFGRMDCSCLTPCMLDTNDDCTVDADDLLRIIQEFGTDNCVPEMCEQYRDEICGQPDISWNDNPESDVDGYIVYFNDVPFDVGNKTLVSGSNIYLGDKIEVSCYDTSGNESGKSPPIYYEG